MWCVCGKKSNIDIERTANRGESAARSRASVAGSHETKAIRGAPIRSTIARAAGEYGVVIGADGIHSSIRRLVFGDIPRPVGQISWRFIADDACGVTTWTAMLARGRAFLMMPVGSGGLYCYADLLRHGAETTFPWSDGAEKGPARSRVHERDALRALFGDFAEPVPRLLAQLDRVDAIHVGPIEEVYPERCVDRFVVLVGDAAHATSPNMAQGASMAVEDALVLADALASADPPRDALAAFAGWMVFAGRNPVDYFAKHPNRFPLIHVKDFLRNADTHAAAAGAAPMLGAELGRGVVDYKPIFAAAAKAGLQHYYVEQEGPFARMSPMQAAQVDYDYLHALA